MIETVASAKGGAVASERICVHAWIDRAYVRGAASAIASRKSLRAAYDRRREPCSELFEGCSCHRTREDLGCVGRYWHAGGACAQKCLRHDGRDHDDDIWLRLTKVPRQRDGLAREPHREQAEPNRVGRKR